MTLTSMHLNVAFLFAAQHFTQITVTYCPSPKKQNFIPEVSQWRSR